MMTIWKDVKKQKQSIDWEPGMDRDKALASFLPLGECVVSFSPGEPVRTLSSADVLRSSCTQRTLLTALHLLTGALWSCERALRSHKHLSPWRYKTLSLGLLQQWPHWMDSYWLDIMKTRSRSSSWVFCCCIEHIWLRNFWCRARISRLTLIKYNLIFSVMMVDIEHPIEKNNDGPKSLKKKAIVTIIMRVMKLKYLK